VLEVLTPFTVYTSLKTTDEIERLVVHDADGKHAVKVEQVHVCHLNIAVKPGGF
jgi:hypothetical protein